MNVQYENFRRHLREKYATRLHIAEQILDQRKCNRSSKQSAPLISVHKLNRQNMIQAQQEISFPLISYLNEFQYVKSSLADDQLENKPYFNECVLAAERIKHQRHTDRDRKLCYENYILAQKLEGIKSQTGQNARVNLEKDYQRHCRLLMLKANSLNGTNNLIKRKFPSKRLSSNEQDISSNEDKSSETIATSCRSSFYNARTAEISSSSNEDDQATVADVDFNMEYDGLGVDILRTENYLHRSHRRRHIHRQATSTKSQDFRSASNSKKGRGLEAYSNNIYQHLSHIDGMLLRDSEPCFESHNSKHFSTCVLPYFDPDVERSKRDFHSKTLLPKTMCAFKKEVLYDFDE